MAKWDRTLVVFLNGQVDRVWDAVRAILGQPSDTFWAEERGLTRQTLLPLLVDTANVGARAAIDDLAARYGIGVDWSLVNTAAQEWARKYAGDLDDLLTTNTRKQVKELVATWIESGEPLSALEKALRSAGEAKLRARTIAVTEVTRAFAEGNRLAWKESEVVQGLRWRVAADELVCPLCLPLQNKTGTLEDGVEGHAPPRHPRCRCWWSPIAGIPKE